MAAAKTPARSKGLPRKAVTKGQQIHIRVTKEQKTLLGKAADKPGAGMSTWILIVALREARKLTGLDG